MEEPALAAWSQPAASLQQSLTFLHACCCIHAKNHAHLSKSVGAGCMQQGPTAEGLEPALAKMALSEHQQSNMWQAIRHTSSLEGNVIPGKEFDGFVQMSSAKVLDWLQHLAL